MEFSHRNLDPLGRKKRGNPGLGGKDLPSHSAVVLGICLLLVFVISHISAAMCEDVLADVVKGSLLIKLGVRTTLSAEARVNCSEVRGWGQPVRELLVELSS